MQKKIFVSLICIMVAIFASAPGMAQSEELVVKSCSELMRMAQNFQEDIKTTDIMLRSALDGGSISSVKTYKLKKEATNMKLQAVMQAINLKGCSRTN